MTLELPRRSFIAGLGALVAAPAIVKVASLMPVKSTLVPEPWALNDFTERLLRPSLDLLELQIAGNVMLITRDAAPLFVNSNPMLRELEHGVDQTLCVRLPNYFHADAFSYALMVPFMRSEVERDLLSQELPAPVAAVALAAAAAPVVEQALKTPVTRRFWSK